MADQELSRLVGELAAKLSKYGLLLAADVDASPIAGIDLDALASRLAPLGREGELVVVSNEQLADTVQGILGEKVPMPIEIERPLTFKPMAAEIDANYSIHNRQAEHAHGAVSDFVDYFNDRLRRMRTIMAQHAAQMGNALQSLEALKSYASGREVYIMGLVSRKFTTKNGNVLVEIEDETGSAKVMFMNGTSQSAKELFERSASIINDEALAVKGKISGPFVIANELIWPDVPIRVQKRIEDDVAIAFISDVHVGSKLFMDKNFSKMISWLNGDGSGKRSELAGRIKYIVVGGDIADGIGVYPNQDRDLAVLDMYTQYRMFFEYMDAIPDYIHVFVLTGNHDAVQRAEPQPPLTQELIGDFKKDNVHMVSNPSMLKLHELDVLAYHGTSLDSIISAVPNMSYARPERAMIEILRRRHLSPIYAGNIVVPSKNDNLVIDTVPDILHMGHIHKNGTANYHGVGIVNSGTWQARTDFQIKQGHMPTPCILPVYDTRSMSFESIDFSQAVT